MLQGLFASMSPDEQALFSEAEVAALERALDKRQRKAHRVDLRGSVKFWRWHTYFVFLSGVDQRTPSRREQELARRGKALLLISVITVSMLFGLLALYLIKSALGINLFPGFSLGIWGWFQGTFM